MNRQLAYLGSLRANQLPEYLNEYMNKQLLSECVNKQLQAKNEIAIAIDEVALCSCTKQCGFVL